MALTYRGSTGTTGASSVSLPTHAVGDIIVIYADFGAKGTSPTTPSAGGTVPTWTTIVADDTNGIKMSYTVATATNHTSGTWTNAINMMAVVLRGQKTSSPVGGYATSFASSSSTSAVTPSITLSKTDGSSQILHFYAGISYSSGFNWSSAPSGYTSRLSVNAAGGFAWGYRMLTKNSTTSDGSATNTTSANTNARLTASLEILAAPTSGFFAMF